MVNKIFSKYLNTGSRRGAYLLSSRSERPLRSGEARYARLALQSRESPLTLEIEYIDSIICCMYIYVHIYAIYVLYL